jgi:hypothetical protein
MVAVLLLDYATTRSFSIGLIEIGTPTQLFCSHPVPVILVYTESEFAGLEWVSPMRDGYEK